MKIDKDKKDISNSNYELSHEGVFKNMVIWCISLFRRSMNHEITYVSSQIAYRLMFSFFPLLILILSIIGKSQLRAVDILNILHKTLPDNAYELVYATVVEVVTKSRTDLLAASAVISLWSGSSAVRSIIKGLNAAYDEHEKRSFPRVLYVSIVGLIAFVLILVFSLFLVVFGEMIGRALVTRLDFPITFKHTWDLVRYVLALLALTFVFMMLYHLVPSKKMSWREVFPGALFSSIGWILSSQIFAFYVNHFTNYSKLYGGLGGIMVLMLWLYITSMILLVGGEINALGALRRMRRKI